MTNSEICDHRQQVVRETKKGIIEQTCLKCKALICSWNQQSGKTIYDINQKKKKD